MVTKVRGYRYWDEPVDYYGLSTDEKPTDCPNGSSFTEMDTGKLYLYDGENGQWLEWGGSNA